MNNFENFLSAYQHIYSLSIPDSPSLRGKVLLVKFSMNSLLQYLLDADNDFLMSLDKCSPADKPDSSVSLGAKREGRRK